MIQCSDLVDNGYIIGVLEVCKDYMQIQVASPYHYKDTWPMEEVQKINTGVAFSGFAEIQPYSNYVQNAIAILVIQQWLWCPDLFCTPQ